MTGMRVANLNVLWNVGEDMRRWCVGDECWWFVFDQSAGVFVPDFAGYVLGVQSCGLVVSVDS
jgi:hypothetical protein